MGAYPRIYGMLFTNAKYLRSILNYYNHLLGFTLVPLDLSQSYDTLRFLGYVLTLCHFENIVKLQTNIEYRECMLR